MLDFVSKFIYLSHTKSDIAYAHKISQSSTKARFEHLLKVYVKDSR